MTANLEIITGPSGASSRGSHQLSCASTCEKRWEFRYKMRIEPKVEPLFRMGGTLIHDSVAHRYAEKMIDLGKPPPSWWTGESIDDVLSSHGAGYPDLITKARAVYDAYPDFWWHGRYPEPWEPIAVEEEFKATVGQIDPENLDGTSLDDEVVTCRTDLVVRNTQTGVLVAVDHKTKGFAYRNKALPTWSDKGEYAISWQAYLNLHILRLNFPDDIVAAMVFNRITREAPHDFDRHIAPHSERVYATVPRTVRASVKRELEIIDKLERGEPLTPAYWACYDRYGACDYRSICDAKDKETAASVMQTQFRARM